MTWNLAWQHYILLVKAIIQPAQIQRGLAINPAFGERLDLFIEITHVCN